MYMKDKVGAVCDIRIGTSGYDYPAWEGTVYPEGIGRDEYIGAYSERFGTVELNFSYYGMPKAENMRRLLARTRKPIDFSIKAHKSLTHEIDPSTWMSSAIEYVHGIEPLAEADRLCAVLLEFPYWFHYREEERRYLARVIRVLGTYPLAVEFRNAEWLNARVIEGLAARNVALCALDLPRIEGLPPLSDLVTSPELAYVRFHGRNAEAWHGVDGAGRYDYLYTKDELASWVPRIEVMSVQAKRLRIYFNNHRGTSAAANARDMQNLAREAKLCQGDAWPAGQFCT